MSSGDLCDKLCSSLVVFVLVVFAGSGGFVGSFVVVDTMHVISFFVLVT
jgi:hypothetical protein